MKKYFIIFIVFVFTTILVLFHFVPIKEEKNEKVNQVSQVIPDKKQPMAQVIQEDKTDNQVQENTETDIFKKIEQKVAFVVQAPFANWKDPAFQNACEEAAMIMAMSWVENVQSISAQDAQNKIAETVNFEDKKFKYNADTDINDMKIIFRDFFHYSNVDVRENIALDDIKKEIQNGSIVLVPTFGRELKNPHYTSPGPITHMLVIIGYDPDAKKFITNDSGTKYGKSYLYPENVLFEAIWQYESGPEMPEPPLKIRKKGMIVVKK